VRNGEATAMAMLAISATRTSSSSRSTMRVRRWLATCARRSSAIVGLTGYITKGHIARAVLEATAWQTREVVDAMVADSGVALTTLKVDGGMTANSLLMQFQSDILQTKIKRPKIIETTAIGAAFLAGLAVGFWESEEELQSLWESDKDFEPKMEAEKVDYFLHFWHKAVERSKNWVE
jgi:glycerol kinase